MNKLLGKLDPARAGLKAEAKTGKRLGGKVHAGSGAIKGYKGDITLGQFLIENKSSRLDSMGLKRLWLEKIRAEALAVNKFPALAIQFTNSEGTTASEAGRWIAVPEHVFQLLLEKEL